MWLGVELHGARFFNQDPVFHHQYTIGKARGEGDIAGGKDDRHPEICAQLADDIEHLPLNSYIEPSRWLIAAERLCPRSSARAMQTRWAVPPLSWNGY